MTTFAYVVRSKAGEELTGFLSAGNLDEVVTHLHRQDLTVLNVQEDRGQGSAENWAQRFAQISFGRVSTRDLALFNRQLATVLEAGIPLVRGLRALASDSGSPVLKKAIADIAMRIERGEHLSDAMTAHPECFNHMYLSMIRAGERAGTLDRIVDQMAIYLEKVDEIQTKVRSALSYPVLVLSFSVLVTLFLLIKIVPTFSEIYEDLGQELPMFTKMVLAASDLIRTNAIISIAIGLLAVLIGVLVFRTRSGRYACDATLLRVPVFGSLVRKAVMSRFSRTFSILLQSGLPLLESLDLVRGAAGNRVVARAIGEARAAIAAGRGITESFRATKKFPEMVLQMMSTGEETGDLDAMLLKTSDFYDRQVEASVHGLASLIEPLMIVMVGILIGAIVIAMFLPIFHLGEAVMQGGYNL